MIRDRIVVGIRDEPTCRHLQQKKLTVSDAVDACKASEAHHVVFARWVERRRNRVKIAVGNKATAVDVSTAIASTQVRKKRV